MNSINVSSIKYIVKSFSGLEIEIDHTFYNENLKTELSTIQRPGEQDMISIENIFL